MTATGLKEGCLTWEEHYKLGLQEVVRLMTRDGQFGDAKAAALNCLLARVDLDDDA